jgi:uncharacterized protein involved in response to NO
MNAMPTSLLDRLASRALFMCPFRPMFLAAATYSAVALALWVGFLSFGLPVPGVAGGPVVWHAHEMMFGFGLAAVTGFALTAVPELTGTAPFGSRMALRFASLWLAGRILFWLSGVLGPLPAAVAGVSLPVALAATIGPRLLRDPDRRHPGFLWAILALAAAAAGFHADVLRGAYPMRWIDASVGAMMALVLVALGRISMRIVNDALDATHRDGGDVPEYLARRPRRNLAIAAIAGATLAEFVAPRSAVGGWLALAAAAAVLNVLNDWHVGRALLTRWAFLLYAVYWLMALGYAALGASALGADLPTTSGRHLLTAGVMGVSVFAVMCIAGRIHAGYPLDGRRWVAVAAGLIVAAAGARAISPLAGDAARSLLALSGACWIGAYALAVAHLGVAWWRPRVDGATGCDEVRLDTNRSHPSTASG